MIKCTYFTKGYDVGGYLHAARLKVVELTYWNISKSRVTHLANNRSYDNRTLFEEQKKEFVPFLVLRSCLHHVERNYPA